MKCAIFALGLTVALMPVMAAAKDKNDLSVRTDEAARICDQYLIANAKNPDSIKLDEKYTFGFGRALFRDHIFIYLSGMGMNTYGAVLRHSWTCDVKCKKDQPCSVFELTE